MIAPHDPPSTLTLGKLVRRAAARDPSACALQFENRTWSYGTLAVRIAQAGAAFAALGVGAGDVVLLVSANRPEVFEVVLGASDLGAAVATLNPASTPAEIAAIAADCRPVLAVLEAGAEAQRAGLAQAGVACVELGARWDARLDAAPAGFSPPDVDDRTAFAITYTSGTTGAPKGVRLAHRSRALTALALAGEYGCFGPQDHFIAATPLHHGAGFAYALTNLLFGGSVRLLARADVGAIADLMSGPDATGVFLVPTLLQRLLGLPAGRLRRGPRLKGVVCNASALPQPLKERFVDAYGAGLLHETYGSTEAGVVANLRPDDQLRTLNACGRPIFGVELAIRLPDGAEAQAGEPGELFSRSPYGFLGYVNQAPVDPQGWIGVGDLAMRDARGIVHIVGRTRDVIITGGVNVYPREIESVLLGVAGVGDAAVLAVPDPVWGERIEALFTVSPGEAAPDEAALLAACRSNLSPHKIPKLFRSVDAIPRNSAGKLLRAELTALHGALRGQAAPQGATFQNQGGE